MSIRNFLDYVNLGGKTRPECGQYHLTDWGPGLNKQEKASWAPASISLCFLTVDSMWPVTSHSGHHAFPIYSEIVILPYLPFLHFCRQLFCRTIRRRINIACFFREGRFILTQSLKECTVLHGGEGEVGIMAATWCGWDSSIHLHLTSSRDRQDTLSVNPQGPLALIHFLLWVSAP